MHSACLGSNKRTVYPYRDLKPVSTAKYNWCKQPASKHAIIHVPNGEAAVIYFSNTLKVEVDKKITVFVAGQTDRVNKD